MMMGYENSKGKYALGSVYQVLSHATFLIITIYSAITGGAVYLLFSSITFIFCGLRNLLKHAFGVPMEHVKVWMFFVLNIAICASLQFIHPQTTFSEWGILLTGMVFATTLLLEESTTKLSLILLSLSAMTASAGITLATAFFARQVIGAEVSFFFFPLTTAIVFAKIAWQKYHTTNISR